MFKGSNVFTYLSKKSGVTKEGESYLAINVLTKNSKRPVSFFITDINLIDEINSRQFTDYQDIKLIVEINRVFNVKTRYTNWQVELIGVE